METTSATTRFIPASEAAEMDPEERVETIEMLDGTEVIRDENVLEYMRHIKGRLGSAVHVHDGEFVEDPAVVYDPEWLDERRRCKVCQELGKSLEEQAECSEHIWDPDYEGSWRHKRIDGQTPKGETVRGGEYQRTPLREYIASPGVK